MHSGFPHSLEILKVLHWFHFPVVANTQWTLDLVVSALDGRYTGLLPNACKPNIVFDVKWYFGGVGQCCI